MITFVVKKQKIVMPRKNSGMWQWISGLGDGSLIRPEIRKETTKQNHKRVMRSGSWIQATGPNNGHQLRDYSKSSNRSENRPLI